VVENIGCISNSTITLSNCDSDQRQHRVLLVERHNNYRRRKRRRGE
jgi:hypothetical protein